MKKYIALVLALMMCQSLCACGSNSESTEAPAANRATIDTNEGETVELSAEELFSEFDGNEARFFKLYGGARIQFVGTVKSIDVNTYVYAGSNTVQTEQNKIVFEEGWCLIIGKENISIDLADYYPGQKVEVTTGIVGAPFDTDFIKSICDNNRVVWLVGNDEMNHEVMNEITTIIKPVE